MDSEHQRLVEQINRLLEAILDKQVESTLLPIFDELLEYAKEHFSHEEALLTQHHYHELVGQQEAHHLLINRVMAYRQRLEEGGEVAPRR